MTSASAQAAAKKPAPWTIFDYLKLLAIGFLLLPAAQHMSQDDYAFVRYLATGVAAYAMWRAYQKKLWGWLLAFGAMLIVFNPVLRVHLWREAWVAVDLAAVALLGLSLRVAF